MLFTLGVAWGFHRGVVFEKEGDVLLTDSHWTIVLQYNLTEVEEENQKLSSLLTRVKGQYDKLFQDLLSLNVSMHSPVRELEAGFRYEYVSLQQLVADYVTQTSDLVSLLPSTRQRRGLIDVGGQVLNFLFGTVTDSDLEFTNNRINEIENLSDDLFHDTKDQITILGNMQSEISTHSRAINKVISTLKEYDHVMHITMARNYIGELMQANQMRTLLKYLKLSTALAEDKDAINLAVQKMTRLHLAIEDLAAGRMTSNLLPPHQFLKVLTSVESVIPPPEKLFLDVKLENLHNFYKIATIQANVTKSQLRVLIRLPLKNDNQLFEIFNVIAYPVYDPSLTKWVKWDVADQKLVISKDRQTYSLYSPDVFARECKFGKLTVCPLSGALLSVYKRPNCVVNLLMKEHVTLCSRNLISGLQFPVLIRTPTRWLYTTSEETKVILNCFGRDANPNVSAITLKGEGEIPKHDRCDLIADGYRVTARFIGSSTYSSDFGKIVFPEVDGMYSREERSLLVHDVNETLKVLQGLDDQLGSLCVKEYSLEGTIQLLRTHYRRRVVIKYVTFGGASLVVVLIVVTVLLRWRVRVADLLRAALGVNRRSSQAARTESHLPNLEATVRTASRPDAEDAERWREQDETDRDQSGSMSTPRTKTDIKLTTSAIRRVCTAMGTVNQPVSELNEWFRLSVVGTLQKSDWGSPNTNT
ncbi:hypothetical protein J6590_022347 [Homalodisca vitripennis]|nr:hypothetical protein J6590_022347 [Homalodisca vitripennis]